jgi:hypothetical protein
MTGIYRATSLLYLLEPRADGAQWKIAMTALGHNVLPLWGGTGRSIAPHKLEFAR